MQARQRRRATIGAITLGLLGLVPVGLGLTSAPAGAATINPGDGTSSPTAGASCWGIKQAYPGSTNGVYWLLTPAMDRPAQFYCDMTTDGGGWVLVARGREGFTFSPNGQGSPATLRNTVDGPEAFAPAALDTRTIDALRNGSNLAAEPDGIRLERALNATGTNRQDYRLFPKARTWNWNLDSGQLLNSVRINGTTYQGSNTKDTANSTTGQTTNGLSGRTDERRLITTRIAAHNNLTGFGTGSISGASNAPTNYLWRYSTEPNPIPFTRVWLRPRVANNVSFSAIPSAGFPEQAALLGLKSRSELAPWGVVGINHDGEANNTAWHSNVMAVEVSGDRVFVGGKFTGVQNGPGAPQIAQRSIAAFDLDGNWISTFRPTVDNGRVWDIETAPDGKLLVVGDFASINGAPNTSNIAKIDPITGAVDPTFVANATYPGGSSIVRAIDIRGDWVYAVGRFTRFKGGSGAEGPVPGTTNFRWTTGQTGNWRPIIHAVGLDVKASADGSRVYISGHFNAVNGDTNHGFHAITNPSNGAVEPGIGPFQPSEGSRTNNWYQQAVGEAGDNILVGGAEHNLHLYNRNRTTLIDSSITKNGGDFQAIEVIDGSVYASCHCMNWNYSGSNSWDNPRNFRAVDPIRMIGRWDAATLDYDTTWWPNGTKGTNDEGIWAIDQDARKCLWVGGDLIRGAYSGNAATDYLGGFARFCPNDAVAPTTPGNVSATADATGVSLSWSASTDAGGGVSYDVYRDDRVIAQVWGTSYRDTSFNGPASGARYTVRASDARGNRSASPAPIVIDMPVAPVAVPVTFGSTWSYADNGTDQGTAWRANGFADGTWASGPAPLGWGGAQATTIGATRPVTAYFRKTFQVANPSEVAAVELDGLFTQGAVLYVNGVEAGRFNMPNGTITSSTVASAYVCCAEDARVKSYVIPGSLLTAGTNTIAVEVHGWRASTGRLSFDLRATLRGKGSDTSAPTAPVVAADRQASGIAVSWTAASDDRGVTSYVVRRGGQPVAVVDGTTTTWLDGAGNPAGPETYVVTAVDANGNATSSAPLTTYPSTTRTLTAWGSVWSFESSGNLPAGNWHGTAFDDAAWGSGAGGFGWGDPFAVTQTSSTSPRPLTTYFRTSFDLDDPARFGTLEVEVVAHAGAVIYVNGVEVGRANMPEGPVGPNTYSLPPLPAAERKVPVRFTVPASMLVAGENIVSAELHLNYRSQPSGYFDAQVIGTN